MSEDYVFHKLLTFPLRLDQILRILLLKAVLLLVGPGSALSEVRLTVFERDPSVEGSTVPAQDMAAETSSVVGRIWISCIRGETHRIQEKS